MGNFADRVDLVDGRRLLVHPASVCEPPCAVHTPSAHPLRVAPFDWHDDAHLLVRVCDHGLWHPDPDGLSYEHQRGLRGTVVHECDGCCWSNLQLVEASSD